MGPGVLRIQVGRWVAQKRQAAASWQRAVWWCVDVESTGVDPSAARIVAVAAVPVREGVVRYGELFATRVRPGRSTRWGAAEVHHLLPQEVEDQPPLREVLQHLDPCLREGILLGHGVRLDLRLLRAAYRACGIPWPGTRAVDTIRLLQHLEHRLRWVSGGPVPLGLQAARAYLGLPPYPGHDAAADAAAAAELFIALAHRLGARTARDLLRWGGVG